MTLLDQSETPGSSDSGYSPFSDSSPETGENNIDDLANTPQPPPELRNEQTIQKYEFYRKNAHEARIFYEVDRTLDQEDRVALFKAFRLQMYSQYVGAFVGLAAGLTLPKYVCKYINRPYKPSYSTLTGVVTVVAGYSVAERMSCNYNMTRYQGNNRYHTIIKSMSQFPPVIGYAYYQETIRRPDSTFPDPSKFDWNRYPSFPLVLTSYGWYRKDIKGISETAPPRGYQRPGQTTSVPHTQFGETSTEGESTKVQPSGHDFSTDTQSEKRHSEPTTWEKIRAQNQGKRFEWEPQHQQHAHLDPLEQQQQKSSQNSNFYGSKTNENSSSKPQFSNSPSESQDFFDDPYAEKGQSDTYGTDSKYS